MKKKLALLFCMLSCILMLAGCSLVRENENFDKKTLEAQTDEFVASWFAQDFQAIIDTYQAQMDETTLAQYQEFVALKKKYVNVKEKVSTTFTITQESATVNETWLCEKDQKVVISLTFDETGAIQVDETGMYSLKFEDYKTLGDKMKTAGINTIMCMAIVFAVLIFISLLIGCFKFFGAFQKNQADTSSSTVVTETAPAAVEENLADDLELVAVITAAIAAAGETESADGLVVRSIIRRS